MCKFKDAHIKATWGILKLAQHHLVFPRHGSVGEQCPPLRADGHSSLQNQGGIKVQPCDQLTLILSGFRKMLRCYPCLFCPVVYSSGFHILSTFGAHRMARASLSGVLSIPEARTSSSKNNGGDCLWQALPHGSSMHGKNAAWLDKLLSLGDTMWYEDSFAWFHFINHKALSFRFSGASGFDAVALNFIPLFSPSAFLITLSKRVDAKAT